jgi:hypothetical protein
LSFSIPSIKTVTPTYFIGDSNVLTFRNLLIDLPSFFPRPSVTCAHFVRGLSAATIFADGLLHESVARCLKDEIGLRASMTDRSEHRLPEVAVGREIALAMRASRRDAWNTASDPVIVLMLGTAHALALLADIGPATDFFCDDPRYVDGAFPSLPASIVPAAIIEERLELEMRPLVAGIAALRELGVTRIYLHSLHPPTMDDLAFFEIRGLLRPAKLRYKIALAINRIFRRIATEVEVGYLDMWAATTRDGVLDESFSLDGEHLNARAAALTIEALFGDLVRSRSRPLRASRRVTT